MSNGVTFKTERKDLDEKLNKIREEELIDKFILDLESSNASGTLPLKEIQKIAINLDWNVAFNGKSKGNRIYLE